MVLEETVGNIAKANFHDGLKSTVCSVQCAVSRYIGGRRNTKANFHDGLKSTVCSE